MGTFTELQVEREGELALWAPHRGGLAQSRMLSLARWPVVISVCVCLSANSLRAFSSLVLGLKTHLHTLKALDTIQRRTRGAVVVAVVVEAGVALRWEYSCE